MLVKKFRLFRTSQRTREIFCTPILESSENNNAVFTTERCEELSFGIAELELPLHGMLKVCNMTTLSAPFTPENLQEQIVCPETVKILQFMEGVSSAVKKTFLLAFKWIETLKFEKTPIPQLPEGFVLQYVTKFEMSPGAYNESDELQNFFRSITEPSGLKNFEMQPDYANFLSNAKKLQLDTLSLWLIDHEEFLTMSLKLVGFQQKLTSLDINQPYGYRNSHSDFSTVIQNNSNTLRKITIPRIAEFDCSVLKNCTVLHEFSLGMEFHFFDFENFGSITNVQDFPCSPGIHTISIGSPMLKTDIIWMAEKVPAKTLMFIGSPLEEYSLKDIKSIVESCSKNKKSLMMCVSMSHTTFKLFEAYLNRQSNISIRVIYHCQPSELSPGTAHFSLCFDLKNQLSSFIK
ncbi:unnamed protein product [Allacma fusca]|uniref:Uncharacterized protein n=1 Tax=Allacma fusca TaxID=39272 RepID=A0A8J2Q576_9HEXA|nr:unnamed protein product [Allacma fusca]